MLQFPTFCSLSHRLWCSPECSLGSVVVDWLAPQCLYTWRVHVACALPALSCRCPGFCVRCPSSAMSRVSWPPGAARVAACAPGAGVAAFPDRGWIVVSSRCVAPLTDAVVAARGGCWRGHVGTAWVCCNEHGYWRRLTVKFVDEHVSTSATSTYCVDMRAVHSYLCVCLRAYGAESAGTTSSCMCTPWATGRW